MHEPIREQNACHVIHIPSTLSISDMEYFYQKLGDATMYNDSKRAVMNVSDNVEFMS